MAQTVRTCVQSKWKPVSNSPPNMIVKFHLRLNADGKLAEPPIVTNQTDDPAFRGAAENAVKAVRACEPFKLPKDRYELWKDMVLSFNPRDAR